MRLITTIQGCDVLELNDSSVTFTAKAAVDTDGSGPRHGDPCAQRDTSLHLHGKALNADVDKYVVVPPAILNGVKGVVLGCSAHALNLRNGHSSDAVVGDIGPHTKIGEISVALAKALGLNPSPNNGGTEEHIIAYTLHPGVPAVVDGKAYALQPK